MLIEMRNIETIKPYDKNPRNNDDAVAAVANSIREFGFRQPIVVDSEGVIIVGHTRYRGALKLNLKEVPVHVAKDLTPTQTKAYLPLNRAGNGAARRPGALRREALPPAAGDGSVPGPSRA